MRSSAASALRCKINTYMLARPLLYVFVDP